MGNDKSITGDKNANPDPTCKNCHGKGFVKSFVKGKGDVKIDCFCIRRKKLIRK